MADVAMVMCLCISGSLFIDKAKTHQFLTPFSDQNAGIVVLFIIFLLQIIYVNKHIRLISIEN